MSSPLRLPLTEPDADLLTPTLTAEDDLTGFAAPWNPQIVVILVLLCGPLAGGALLALNFRRLGLPRHAGKAFAAFAALALASAALVGWLTATGQLGTDATQKRTLRFGLNIAAVLLALVFLRRQSRRYRLWEMCGGKPAPLLGPGVLAFVAGLAATMGLHAAASAIARSLA